MISKATGSMVSSFPLASLHIIEPEIDTFVSVCMSLLYLAHLNATD